MVFNHRKAFVARFSLILTLLAGILGVAPIRSVHAATHTVTNTTDSSAGSLRHAVAIAAPGDTITFDPSLAGGVIQLGTPLSITKDLTIDGSGLNPQIALSGEGVSGIMQINFFADVTISDLVFTKGIGAIIINGASNLTILNSTFSDNSGGAIVNSGGGTLTVRNSTFTRNSKGGDGAAIYSSGWLTVENSTFEQNQASGAGGAIAITTNGTSCCTITNSTISRNQAGTGGAFSIVGNGNVSIANTTFFQNQAVNIGGGFYMNGNPIVDVVNSTFTDNNATQGSQLYIIGNGAISLYNTILFCKPENSSCIVEAGPFNISNVNSVIGTGTLSDFGLGELADNGGPTQTMALLPGSPLIDAGGDANCPATDQRGVARPQGRHCDIGAYEFQPVVHYVKWDASGANNGTSWTDAFTDLQSALAVASVDEEIWVAGGTYKPTTGTDRTISFRLKNDVAIYGGFAGTETSRSQRDPAANLTVVSGDIGALDDNNDNSYHVIVGSSTDNSAVLDGFTITRGNANGSSPNNLGGGMYNLSGNPSLRNLIFSNNSATSRGGGMSNQQSSPLLKSVSFNNNSSGVYGGGMYNFANSDAKLTDVTFFGNTAGGPGAGMYNGSSSPTLVNVTFSENVATGSGGGMNNSSSSPILMNVTFSANSANGGGGMKNDFSSPNLMNVIFLENTSSSGGGMLNLFSSPILTDVTFSRNSATSAGGGLYNGESSPTLTNVTFSENSAISGAGMDNHNNSNAILTNVTFYSNSARDSGGGMVNVSNSNPALTNVTFSGNSSTIGSGLYNNTSNPILVNVVLWDNIPPAGAEIYNFNSAPLISYSIVQGGYPGTGNLDADPLFGPLRDNGGFTQTMALGIGSPAIDAGDDANCPSTDQRGVTRPQGDHCDIGAFEYEGPFPFTLTPSPTSTLTHTPTSTPTNTPTNTPTPTNTSTPTATPPYSYYPLYLSLTGNQAIGGVSSADEDILRFDGQNWSLFFDGSDVGVGSADLFAFSIVDADTILMSFNNAITLNSLAIAPQDVVQFDATPLGSTTAGTFSMYLDGSDVGLDVSAEKIDAVSLLPDGRLLISTTGNPAVAGVAGGRDEDVLAFTPASLGNNTSGTWAMYFDGSDVGLGEMSGEDVDGLDVVNGKVYLSTLENFAVNGVSGADEDVFVCEPISLGDITACNYSLSLYFDGSTWGLSPNDVDAFNVLTIGSIPTPTPTGTPTNTPTPTKTSRPSPTATVTFTPTPTTTPPTSMFIQIVQPNGGEVLTVGSTYRITWDSTSDIDKVTIGYKSCDSCLDWIANNIPNVGYYDWTVNVGNTTNTQFKIDIIGYDTGVGSVTDRSDNFFTVLQPTPTPDTSDLIFADGFESGDLLAWSSSSTDQGDISVSSAAALAPAGTQGMQVLIDDDSTVYVTDDSPSAETRYRARFYFDPNSIVMANGDAHFIFKGFMGTSNQMLQVEFRNASGAYQLRAKLLNDSAAFVVTNWLTISDASHFIELDWRAATAAGANNGGLTFWIDGDQQAEMTGVDNDTWRIDRIRLGAVAGLDAGTRGTYYFDDFESRPQSYIGP